MKERPILFSAPMVRALLAGTKTQTRRPVRKQFAADAEPAEVPATSPEGWQISGHSGLWWDDAGACIDDAIRCPYGMPGDRLWVRETWRPLAIIEGRCAGNSCVEYPDGGQKYRDGAYYLPSNHCGTFDPSKKKWKPSIHMPRRASRTTLEITGVRVDRLQDISDQDAIAEGVRPILANCEGPNNWTVDAGGMHLNHPTAVGAYSMLWDWINGEGSWDANPWVWVVEFNVMKGGVA